MPSTRHFAWAVSPAVPRFTSRWLLFCWSDAAFSFASSTLQVEEFALTKHIQATHRKPVGLKVRDVRVAHAALTYTLFRSNSSTTLLWWSWTGLMCLSHSKRFLFELFSQELHTRYRYPHAPIACHSNISELVPRSKRLMSPSTSDLNIVYPAPSTSSYQCGFS